MTDNTPTELDDTAALYAATVAAAVNYRRTMRLNPDHPMTAALPPAARLTSPDLAWLTDRLAEAHITIAELPDGPRR